MTDEEITTIACSHCKYVHEGEYRITQFESKSALVAFARECIDHASPASPAADRAELAAECKRLLNAIPAGALRPTLDRLVEPIIATIDALARSTDAPGEPMLLEVFQHSETGRLTCCPQEDADAFAGNNPRWLRIHWKPAPATPPAASTRAPDDWRQYATEREDTAQQVIERHRREYGALLKMLAKARAASTSAQGEDETRLDAMYSNLNRRIDAMHEGRIDPVSPELLAAARDALAATQAPAVSATDARAERTLHELNEEIGRLQSELTRRVLGDPVHGLSASLAAGVKRTNTTKD